MFSEIAKKLNNCMVWVLTLSVSFLLIMLGLLIFAYSYVIFTSKYIDTKFSVGYFSAQISNFQDQITNATKANTQLSLRNKQLLDRIEKFYVSTGSSNAVSGNYSQEEIIGIKELVQNQINLLDSQKSNLDSINRNLYEFKEQIMDKQAENK
ncbi:Uncharacterised protein [Legionella wadsworthii]|uniref:Uncharacterized protein n=1 Tax=Legionella wadsworthii TaxID=28088 RepID=A0A378LSJ1_9GAMM|nr:hypothetical protein [Legionella wadsworthii]STY28802.1 Uncharacterised protein [Legionella wadsworthii]